MSGDSQRTTLGRGSCGRQERPPEGLRPKLGLRCLLLTGLCCPPPQGPPLLCLFHSILHFVPSDLSKWAGGTHRVRNEGHWVSTP